MVERRRLAFVNNLKKLLLLLGVVIVALALFQYLGLKVPVPVNARSNTRQPRHENNRYIFSPQGWVDTETLRQDLATISTYWSGW